MTDQVDLRRAIDRLDVETRRRTDALAIGLYMLLALHRDGGLLSTEFWSKWNAACARRDDEYPAPRSEASHDDGNGMQVRG